MKIFFVWEEPPTETPAKKFYATTWRSILDKIKETPNQWAKLFPIRLTARPRYKQTQENDQSERDPKTWMNKKAALSAVASLTRFYGKEGFEFKCVDNKVYVRFVQNGK